MHHPSGSVFSWGEIEEAADSATYEADTSQTPRSSPAKKKNLSNHYSISKPMKKSAPEFMSNSTEEKETKLASTNCLWICLVWNRSAYLTHAIHHLEPMQNYSRRAKDDLEPRSFIWYGDTQSFDRSPVSRVQRNSTFSTTETPKPPKVILGEIASNEPQRWRPRENPRRYFHRSYSKD